MVMAEPGCAGMAQPGLVYRCRRALAAGAGAALVEHTKATESAVPFSRMTVELNFGTGGTSDKVRSHSLDAFSTGSVMVNFLRSCGVGGKAEVKNFPWIVTGLETMLPFLI